MENFDDFLLALGGTDCSFTNTEQWFCHPLDRPAVRSDTQQTCSQLLPKFVLLYCHLRSPKHQSGEVRGESDIAAPVSECTPY